MKDLLTFAYRHQLRCNLVYLGYTDREGNPSLLLPKIKITKNEIIQRKDFEFDTEYTLAVVRCVSKRQEEEVLWLESKNVLSVIGEVNEQGEYIFLSDYYKDFYERLMGVGACKTNTQKPYRFGVFF